MDSSSQRTSSIADDFHASLLDHQEGDAEEHHIHMPNPSYWPLLVGLAVAITIGGLLFVSNFPWLSVVGAVLVLITILGWALEDPMAPVKDKFVAVYRAVTVDRWKYKIGQNVVDGQGKWLGTIQARFSRYILVERGRLLPKVYYVPQNAIKDTKGNTVLLTLSEEDLERMELTTVPADLYDEESEGMSPVVRGAPQFARRPLSPAETGHYNYGRMSPGINTDASGSYHRNEVLPKPSDYVVEDFYSTDEPIPSRIISPD
jgi:Cytochrome c oxidase subunit IV